MEMGERLGRWSHHNRQGTSVELSSLAMPSFGRAALVIADEAFTSDFELTWGE
jgi:hypothetical protein